jgi:hypothetical protein
LSTYKSGDYQNTRKILEKLFQNDFEVLSTRMHLSRLALITDNLAELSKQINEAWQMHKDAKNYILARIIWFKITLAFLNKSSPGTSIGQLKTVLGREDAFMEWTMQPVLDHIKPKITDQQYAFLSVLVDALNAKQNLDKLNEFEDWRKVRMEQID